MMKKRDLERALRRLAGSYSGMAETMTFGFTKRRAKLKRCHDTVKSTSGSQKRF